MAILKTNFINGEKPQFGNTSHIQFVKNITKMANKGRVDINPIYSTETKVINHLSFNYICGVCGKNQSDFLSNDYDDDFNHFRVVCKDCDAEYKVLENSLLLN